MVTNGRLESVGEEVGRQLSSRCLGSLVNIFQCPSHRFDLLLSKLLRKSLVSLFSHFSGTQLGWIDLIVEIFGPPLWH